MPKRLVILSTPRYHVNFNDFYMFFRRTGHSILAVLYHESNRQLPWWRENRIGDLSREQVFDPIDRDDHRFRMWRDADELLQILEGIDFDLICMGNGTEAVQREVIARFGRQRCLFSEYGWLAWSRHFYLSRGGCGTESELAAISADDLASQPVHHDALERLRESFGPGWPVWRRNYVYLPLQKDEDDFKFTLTHFRNNDELLAFVHELLPRGMRVLVKRHPLHYKRYDLSRYGRRYIDISRRKLSKASLYRNMAAMISINSTSVLEALLFGKHVFAYGDDLFRNKGVVHERVDRWADFEARLNRPFPRATADRFLSLLLDRQVDRHRCVSDDRRYIENHYWNLCV